MAVAGALALFPVATLAISLVESPPLAIPDASPIYLVAVVGVAVVLGTPAAITAAFLSFVLYNWLFVAPRFTLIVQDPTEWLNLLLLLFVGIVIGRLAALQSERAEDAARRARESQALFRISRTLATAPRVADALPAIVDGLANETRMLRIWIGRLAGVREVVVADSGSGSYTSPQIHGLLTRTPGDLPARWVRAHVGRSIGYDVRAVHISDDPTEAALVRAAFERQIPGVPLVVVDSPYRALAGPLLAYLDVLDAAWPPGKLEPITFVVVPEYVARSWWERLLYNQSATRLRAALLGRSHTVIVNVPYRREEHDAEGPPGRSETDGDVTAITGK